MQSAGSLCHIQLSKTLNLMNGMHSQVIQKLSEANRHARHAAIWVATCMHASCLHDTRRRAL